MTSQLSQQEFIVYFEILVKALHGARSTLRLSYPEYVARITEVIELPQTTPGEIEVFLLKSHALAISARHDVYQKDQEASHLFDAIHNIPYGLLGRFDGRWDWREHLPKILGDHEEFYLRGLRKYTGMLTPL